MSAASYNTIVVLKQPLRGLECWNLTKGSRFDLEAGCRLKVEHAHDDRRTTCMLVDEAGKAIPHATNANAYRFIVGNCDLNAAAGTDLPEVTDDLVGDILDLEGGHATPEQTRRILDSGICGKLQGFYGRLKHAAG